MESFDAIGWAVFVIATTLGFAVRGGAGFGGGIVAVPLLVLVAPLPSVVPMTSALNTMASIEHGVREWRKAEWRELMRIAPFAVIGAAIGIVLLAYVNSRPLSHAFGLFVIAYAAYMLYSAGRMPAIPRRWLAPLAVVLGLIGGAIGSLFGGAAGPVFVMYFNALNIEKDRFRATLAVLMVALGMTRICGYALTGLYTPRVLFMLAAGFPLMLLGSYIGYRIVQRLNQQWFNIAIGGVLLLAGATLMFK